MKEFLNELKSDDNNCVAEFKGNTKGFLKIGIFAFIAHMLVQGLVELHLHSIIPTWFVLTLFALTFTALFVSMLAMCYSLMTLVYPQFFNRYRKLVISPPKSLSKLATF